MAKTNEYYIGETDINGFLSKTDGTFPGTQLNNFIFSDNSHIEGVLKTEPWQNSIGNEYIIDLEANANQKILVRAGDSPKFTEHWSSTSANSYYLWSDGTYLNIGSTSDKSDCMHKSASDFRDKVIPNRMILILQGGGGAGGAGSGVYAGGWCIGGADGGAGGGGCAVAIVINTEYLKNNPSTTYYRIKVGAGGRGGGGLSDGAIVLGNGAYEGPDGGSGGNSEFAVHKAADKGTNVTTLISACGGGGGTSGSGYNCGSPGGYGTWSISGGENEFWWPLPCTTPNGSYSSSTYLNGTNGGSYGQAGGSTSQYTPRAISRSNYYTKNKMYLTLGGKSGGSAGQGASPGGGASWFGNGGSGGDAGSGGNAGGIGAGGGGARYCYAGWIGIIVFAYTIASKAIKAGGNGGNGCAYLYY